MLRRKPTYETWWFGLQGYAIALCSSYERKLEVLRSVDLWAVETTDLNGNTTLT